MSSRFFRLLSWVVLSLLLAMLVAGCTRSADTDEGNGGGTGGITARIVWPNQSSSLSITPLLHPGTVITIRAIVTGPDMTAMEKDFVASTHEGSISGVPAGSDRTLVFQGLDVGSIPIFQGTSTGITVNTGATANAGVITMVGIGAAPPDVTGFAAAGGDGAVVLSWTNPVSTTWLH